MGISEVTVAERRSLRAPFPASLAVSVGDLTCWDNVAKFAKPANQRTDTGSKAGNQADFTPLFFGVSSDQRLSTETSVTTVATNPNGPSDRTVVGEGIFNCSCSSATWEFGDLVGIDRDGTNNVNLNQQVVKVTDPRLALGFVIKREPTAVTTVRCFLSAYMFGWFAAQGDSGTPPSNATKNGITAHAGGGQGSAVALVIGFNRVTTVATAGDSVVLPTSVAGDWVVVENAAANSTNVFPATGDTINSLGANNASALPGGQLTVFYCMVAGTWNAEIIDPRKINTTISTVGAGTLTAAGLVGSLITRSGSTAAYTDTTDTAANIIAALPNAAVGASWKVEIRNTVAFNETLAGGTGVTLSGNTVIPPNSAGEFLLTVASATTVTMLGVACYPLTNPPLFASTGLATVGAGTITAAGIVGGQTARTGSTAAFTDTTDTAANIQTALPNANIGQSWYYTYTNNTTAKATIAGGTGVTVSGLTVIPQNSWVEYLCTLTATNTVTMVAISSGPNLNLPNYGSNLVNSSSQAPTYTAAQLTGFNCTTLRLTGAPAGAVTGTMDTTANIIAAIPNAQTGMTYRLRVLNHGLVQTVTLTAGDGSTTINGTATIATNTFRDFDVTVTSATTLTLQAVGTGTES